MIFRTDVKSTLLYLALLTGAAVSQQAIALQNNESLENLSGSQGSTVFHTLTVPRGASQLSIGISGGRGDADLYVKIGSRPSTSSYNCRPYRNGNNETCSASSPPEGIYYIMVRAYSSFSGVTLTVSYRDGSSQTVPTPAPAPAPSPAPAPGLACLSDLGQELLNAHNAARSQGRLCNGQFKAAAPPLEWNCKLQQAATGHSNDMASNNFFSHTGSNGSGIGQRVSNTGYVYRAAGENIAGGHQSVSAVMQSWLQSTDGHCEAIMNPIFTEIGSHLSINSGTRYTRYWTTVFAKPQ